MTWKATNKSGEEISGTLTPSIIDLETIDIEYEIGEKDKWIQDLDSPPVFTLHIEGGDYEDVVFTISEQFFSRRSDCKRGYTIGDYKDLHCLYLYKKQSCELNETVCKSVQYNVNYMCTGYGFKLLQAQEE